jgi:hypothetical protein
MKSSRTQSGRSVNDLHACENLRAPNAFDSYATASGSPAMYHRDRHAAGADRVEFAAWAMLADVEQAPQTSVPSLRARSRASMTSRRC